MSQSRSRIAPTLHIVLILHGEQEGEQTRQTARTHLLHSLSDLLMRLGGAQNLQAVSILLEPGTIILEDVAALRPELVLALAANTVLQRFRVNPWYAQPEPLLAGGEALARDLMLARYDAERHGLALAHEVTLPQSAQFPAQLPQILAGFRIEAALLPPGSQGLGLPFRWQAPDSSSILVLSQEETGDAAVAIKKQREAQPDGPFLWRLSTSELLPSLDALEEELALPSQYSSLEAYVEAVRSSFPDELRPVLAGSLNAAHKADASYAAVRVPFKQEVARLRDRLLWLVEPLLALALSHSTLPFPENEHALLQQCWRWLLQNQTQAVATGAVSDDAQFDAVRRNHHVAEYADWILERALTALPGAALKGEKPTDAAEAYIVVWNGQGQRISQLVTLALDLPTGRYPAVLFAPNGDEVTFTWNRAHNEISFLALAPSIGYSTYTLALARQDHKDGKKTQTEHGKKINTATSSFNVERSTLDWKTQQYTIEDFLRYDDGGDAGDVMAYQQPKPDVIVPGSIVGNSLVDRYPWGERLDFHHRLRIAPRLQDGKSRARGVKALDIRTTAILYHEQPGVHLHIEFDNTAQDHRLRAYLRTGLAPKTLYVDDVYGLRKIPLKADAMPSTMLVPSTLALYDKERGFTLNSRVPIQVEPILEDAQVTLAITLLRAVGWVAHETGQKTDSAQAKANHALDFWVQMLPAEEQPDVLYENALAYRAPLLVKQYAQPLEYKQYSYLQVQHAQLVALKPAPRLPGLIARLLNPTDEEQQVIMTHGGLVRQAQILNFAEEPIAGCPVVSNRVLLTLKPHEVATVWLDVF